MTNSEPSQTSEKELFRKIINGFNKHVKLRASVLSAYSKVQTSSKYKLDTIKSEKQHKSEAIESKIHERERKMSNVKSTISKLEKDADECYHNAENPDADTVIKRKFILEVNKGKKIVLNDLEK